jgi:serine/threonine-protein kinase
VQAEVKRPVTGRPAATQSLPGYRLIKKIGQGGMAVVYKGVQTSLERPVAIKVLSKQVENHSVLLERFNRESLIIARLNHPHIIHVIDRGTTRGGMPYFVMEFVDGIDLQAAIRGGKLSFTRKLDLVIQICKALSYAHRNGVIHRDIKPANVLIDRDGHARVADFGIAQLFGGSDRRRTTAHSDMIIGSLPYMSPEQQHDATKVTARSDLYSLGALAYELFTGVKPVGRFRLPSEILPHFPRPLEKVILRCLDPDPKRRPATADEIKGSLLKLLRGAHLDNSQKERASQGIAKIEDKFALLDVMQESTRGAVYLYENREDQSLLVIKKKPSTNPGLEEARRLTTLEHPNIASILGTSTNDRFFIIVMEYLTGGSLKDRLIQAFPIAEALKVTREICEGLSFAHQNGIVHGSLHPGNILFGESGRVKIADFGLDEYEGMEGAYSLQSEWKSVRADIFATAVIFYQMSTGSLPEWEGNDLVPNDRFFELPPEVQGLMARMLMSGGRPPEMILDRVVEEIDAISDAYDKTAVLASEPEPSVAVRRMSRVRRALLDLLFLLFGAGAVGGCLYYSGRIEDLMWLLGQIPY